MIDSRIREPIKGWHAIKTSNQPPKNQFEVLFFIGMKLFLVVIYQAKFSLTQGQKYEALSENQIHWQ